MASLTLIFWIALLLPGYALARLVDRADTRDGLLGVIAISMLGTFALLSPVNILGHIVEAPLWVFSAWIILLLIASLIIISRNRWWRDIGAVFKSGASIEIIVVLVALILAARAGSYMIGDSVVHLSRISLLIHHGLNNGHPFYGGNFFFPTYHTNILHALMASCSQITTVDHLDVWWAARPVGMLLAIGGTYYLARTVFDRTWAAWAAALCVLGIYGSLPYLIYPNKLAPLWIAPLILAFVIQAIRSPSDWRPIAKLAVASIVLGQIHGMYVVFCVLLFTPVLTAAAFLYITRRNVRPALLTFCACAALSIGLAFPIVSAVNAKAFGQNVGTVLRGDADETVAAAANDAITTSQFGTGFSGKPWRPLLVVIMAIPLVIFLKRRRMELTILAGVFLIAAAWLWIPPLYQLLLNVLGERWILGRMEFIFRLLFALIVAGGAIALLDWLLSLHPKNVEAGYWRITPWRVASLSVFALGAYAFGSNQEHNWRYLYDQALATKSVHRKNLMWMDNLKVFVEQHIEPGSRVLCPPLFGMLLTAVHDCRIVAGATNNLGVPDAQDRLEDQQVMLSELTPEATREQLLDEYDVEYVAFIAQPRQWALQDAEHMWNRQFPAVKWNISIIQLDRDES